MSKRYIVTEEQLENYKEQIRLIGDELEPDLRDLWKAEDACRAIEVPAWATHFASRQGEFGEIPYEIRLEEIPGDEQKDKPARN